MSSRCSAFVPVSTWLTGAPLLGVLACGAPTSSGNPPESASSAEEVAADSKISDAMVQVSEVARALGFYTGLNDACPSSVDDLVGPSMLDASPVDPWGTAMTVRCQKPAVVGGAEVGKAYQVAISAGPDGALDTEDDIFFSETRAERGIAPAPPEAPAAPVPTSVASHRVQTAAGTDGRVVGLWWKDGWRVGLSAHFVRTELQVWGVGASEPVRKGTLKYTTAAPRSVVFRSEQDGPMALDVSKDMLELRPLEDEGVMALDDSGLDAPTVAVADGPKLRVARLVDHEGEGAPWKLVVQGDGAHELPHPGSASVDWAEATVAASDAEALWISVGSRRGDGTDGDRVLRVDRFDYTGAHLGEHEISLPRWPGALAAARVEADGTVSVLFAGSDFGGGGAAVTFDSAGGVTGPFRVQAANVGPIEDTALLRCGGQTWAVGLDIRPRVTDRGLAVAALGSPGRAETPTQLWLPKEGPASRGLYTGGLSTACHEGEAAAIFVYETGSGDWKLVLATWRAR